MSRRACLLALFPAVLAAGCGSTTHASTSSTATAATASTSSTAAVTTQSSSSSSTSTSTSASGTATTTGQQGSTTHPTGGAGITRGSTGSGGGSTNVRVPATFVIKAGGKLEPSSVSSPAFLALEVTLISGDGRAHTILLRTPTPHSLTISPHGRASILIPGLRAGRYELDIDGAARGALMIGGEPGP